MAAETCRWRPLEDIVQVARSAGQCDMRACQCIARHLQVIELRVEPGIHRVAAFASRRKACRDVVENRRLKILLMARVACCR